jgi:hypothetical protein
MTCKPGHSPKYPDFEAGNTLALRHGAWSPRKIDPRAQDLVAQIAPTVTWWQDCDMPAVWSWARCESRIELLNEFLAGRDLDDEKVRPAAELLTRLESQAMGHRSRLGLDPLSRARLGRDTAAASVDLARLWATDSESPEMGVDTTQDVTEVDQGTDTPEPVFVPNEDD